MSRGGFFDQLNEDRRRSDAPFLNFGLLADQAGARRGPTATSLELVDEVLGDTDLAGCRVVDVGCGRGGALRVLGDRRGADPAIGVDRDLAALGAARSRTRRSDTPVVGADALHLPLRGGTVDAVVNIESACLYGDLGGWYQEAARVLAPGGHL
ncbi:MAG: class I SAM-dependent methyltransferase, partial [Actinomycetota bacterium]